MQFFPQPVQRYVSNAIGVSTLHSGEQMSCKHLRGVTQREPINFYHGLLCRVATSKWKQISIAQSIICFALFFVGHTRQGLKCRVCKMNVHVDCQDNAKSCQSKSRLLRRQKSTSEIETRVNQEPPLDEESEYRFDELFFAYIRSPRLLTQRNPLGMRIFFLLSAVGTQKILFFLFYWHFIVRVHVDGLDIDSLCVVKNAGYKPDRLLRPLSGPPCPESPSGLFRSKRRSKRQQVTLAGNVLHMRVFKRFFKIIHFHYFSYAT